jgi:hypothetical protein
MKQKLLTILTAASLITTSFAADMPFVDPANSSIRNPESQGLQSKVKDELAKADEVTETTGTNHSTHLSAGTLPDIRSNVSLRPARNSTAE